MTEQAENIFVDDEARGQWEAPDAFLLRAPPQAPAAQFDRRLTEPANVEIAISPVENGYLIHVDCRTYVATTYPQAVDTIAAAVRAALDERT